MAAALAPTVKVLTAQAVLELLVFTGEATEEPKAVEA
jgi:hypothetical protein